MTGFTYSEMFYAIAIESRNECQEEEPFKTWSNVHSNIMNERVMSRQTYFMAKAPTAVV